MDYPVDTSNVVKTILNERFGMVDQQPSIVGIDCHSHETVYSEDPKKEDYEELNEDSIDNNNDDDNDYEIEEGQILLSALNCGIVINPKKIMLEERFITIILDNKSNNNFILFPGSQFVLKCCDIQSKIQRYSVYFSGIRFEYEDDKFLVFHIKDKVE